MLPERVFLAGKLHGKLVGVLCILSMKGGEMKKPPYLLNRRAFPPWPLVALFIILAACGGGGSDDDPQADSTDQGAGGSPRQPVAQGTAVPVQPISGSAVIINHQSTDLGAIPQAWILTAKKTLHIAYGHTSHGSQLVTGMEGLVGFKGDIYAFSSGGAGGALDLRDRPFAGAKDLGDPDRTAWAASTRAYLNAHPEINVVAWAWCGQVDGTPADISLYLSLMSSLENDYPRVDFVYMTGHLDGTGLAGNVHLGNEQIRSYCKQNGKILYDFEDIELYNPDGVYFGNRIPDDACDYDSNGDGVRDANWAIIWQESHTEGVDWYACEAAHTQPLNANLKAYASWWLWARLAGWSG
jgi:hypothetical protein